MTLHRMLVCWVLKYTSCLWFCEFISVASDMKHVMKHINDLHNGNNVALIHFAIGVVVFICSDCVALNFC